MGRPRTGKPTGRKSHFTGEKEAWLEGFREELAEADDDPGTVYTSATLKFLQRYGYDLPFSTNVEGNPEDDPPDIEETVEPEEKARRAKIYKALRLKLGNYFRNRWKGKKVHTGAIKGILASMQTMSGPGSRPCRKPMLAVYSKLHYATRVKPTFDKVWAEARKTLPESQRVSMCRDHVRESWGKESDDFKAEVQSSRETMYEEALAAWKASRTIPEGTAESYHEAMETLNEVGIPMADALSERLGAHVVILVVGPVGAEQGEVCLRTVFSDTSNLDTSRTWAQFDHKGFTAMENSVVRYGRAAFTKKQCRERAWPPLENGEALSLLDNPGLLHIGAAAGGSGGSGQGAVPAPADGIAPAPTGLAPAAQAAPVAPTPTPSATAAAAAALDNPAPTAALDNPAPTLRDTPALPNVEDTVDDGIDRTDWADSLIGAHAYLSQKIWGPNWTALVEALVEFEWSHYHNEEVGKLPKGRERPSEYADWFKEHRPFKDYGVSSTFGAELLLWWKELGPPTRWDKVGDGEGQEKEPEKKIRFWSGDWRRLNSRGRNGPVLVILGLAWWGQAICNKAAGDGLGAGEAALAADATWQLLVGDVEWVVRKVLTQGRKGMEDLEAGIESGEERDKGEGDTEEQPGGAAEEEVGAKKKVRAKKAPKKTPVGKGQDKPAPVTGAKRKRKGTDDERPAKKAAKAPAKKAQPAVVERPKPRPITRGSKLVAAAGAKETNPAPDTGTDHRTSPAATEVNTDPTLDSASPTTEKNAGGSVDLVTGDATGTSGADTPPPASAPEAATAPVSPPPPPTDDDPPQVTGEEMATDLEMPVESVGSAISAVNGGTTPEAEINAMDVDAPTSNGGGMDSVMGKSVAELRAEIVELRKASQGKKSTRKQELDLDPFADLQGLTQEELAEMVVDWDADEDEDDDGDCGEEDD